MPQRSKTVPVYDNTNAFSEDDGVSEMDVDIKRVDAAGAIKLETKSEGVELIDAISEEDEEEEDDEYEDDDDDWVKMTQEEKLRAEDELSLVKSTFQDDIDFFDTTMVAEYADEIFQHMEHMETTVMPNPRYMDFQTEIEW